MTGKVTAAPIRIGLLVAARIADLAIVRPARVTGHRLVAVAARDRRRAEDFAQRHGVERALGTYADILADSDVEAIYNPLANALHGPWNLAAIQAGKHVPSEKPSASNADEALVVRDAAAAASVTFMEGFHYLYHPVTRRLHELLDSGELGELRAAEIDMFMPAPDNRDPRWSYELAGGALMNIGCYRLHAHHALAHWAGGPPRVAAARAGERAGHPGVDEWLEADLVFSGGATGRARCSMAADRRLYRCRIIGSRGEATALNFIEPHQDDRITVTTANGARTEALGRRSSYTYQLEAFAEHLRDGAPLPTGADDAVASMQLIDDCYRAAGLPLRPASRSSAKQPVDPRRRAATTTGDAMVPAPELFRSKQMTFDAEHCYLSADDCRLADLIDLVNQKTDLADYPYASTVDQNVLIYDGARLRTELSRPARRPRVEAELASALLDGPGIVVLAGAFDDPWVIDRATRQFEAIITAQRAAGGTVGDHFAAGQNYRIWNALEKLALRAPEVFADYYANDLIATACRAWLGPGYQVTSQVNVVNPGGAAQEPHRDYHLGFATDIQAARFPAHVHRLSPALTLQGAVAHTDMPAETGPTMYVPHSQKYLPGYLTWRRPEFREYFEAHRVQLPLRKGDAVFFNPALFHAAGANRTAGVRRMANLLQVSSAFGRAMEAVDRSAMSVAVSPALQAMADDGASPAAIANVIAACAEGYPFPSNLDMDQPVGGLAPPTQADILARAVAERWSRQQLETELVAWSTRRSS